MEVVVSSGNSSLIFKEKEDIIKEKLYNSIGIFVLLKNGFAVVSKCKNNFDIMGPLPHGSAFRIHGISDSVNVGRDIEKIINTIESETSQIFSSGDVNPTLLICELSEAIEADFYNPDSEKPLLAEMLFLIINPQSCVMSVIKYNGERVATIEDKFMLFGCTDERKIGILNQYMKSLKLSEMTIEDYEKVIIPELSEFSGTAIFYPVEFDPTED